MPRNEIDNLRISFSPENNLERVLDATYIFVPATLTVFLVVVLLSAINYIKKVIKANQLKRERLKEKAIGPHYGTCKSSRVSEESLAKQAEERKTYTHTVNIHWAKEQSSSQTIPFTIHPVL